jgi:transposase
MKERCYGGIDVSKDRLDVQVLPQGRSFSVDNTAAGWSQLVYRLRGLSVAALGIEPSGGYERGVIRALLAAGLSVRRINPNKLRQFARARGVLAKNDRLDARLIAEYVAIMPTRVVHRDPAAEQLAAVVTMRRQLCDEHVAVENQTAHIEDAMLQRLNKRRLARLEADILLLDKRMAEIVAGNATLARRYDLLTSMRGVGPTLAFTLIALLPELGQMSRKQIAALVGLAPYDFDSGRLKGHRCIYGGRMPVRNVLYTAALSAARYNLALKTHHNRLAAANKKPKVVIVAVMRKMITILNAMLRDNTAWQPRPA